MASNSDIFNNASMPQKSNGHGKWMALHGVLMLGMLLPMIATAAPLGVATLGDAAVQGLHMVSNMITGITSHFGVLTDMVGNGFGGNFAAHTLQAGGMHGVAAHTAGAAASALTPCDQWLSTLAPQELAGIQSDLQSAYGGMSLCQYHDMNIMHHGVK